MLSGLFRSGLSCRQRIGFRVHRFCIWEYQKRPRQLGITTGQPLAPCGICRRGTKPNVANLGHSADCPSPSSRYTLALYSHARKSLKWAIQPKHPAPLT